MLSMSYLSFKRLFLQIEFNVHMTCQKCVNQIEESMKDMEGIQNMEISLEHGTVVVETDLPYAVIQERIEKTGRQAVLKGYGGLKIAIIICRTYIVPHFYIMLLL